MNDTQWPRWEVFKKDTANKPYQAVGSVHAADADHALLNARNVFVRRPQAVSLWVVRETDIFSRTQEELSNDPVGHENDGDDEIVSYTVFRKVSHRRAMTFMDHVGDVEASDPQTALQQAMTQFDDKPALAWWIIPTSTLISTEPDVADAWFAPAKTKTYKNQSAYGLVSARKKSEE
ncbi:MAG: phenylacetic acid degradation protein [Chloroflexota bacterium]